MLSIIMNIVGYYDGFAISPASSSSRSSSSASSGGVAICVASWRYKVEAKIL
jgi:hypothetical protein